MELRWLPPLSQSRFFSQQLRLQPHPESGLLEELALLTADLANQRQQ